MLLSFQMLAPTVDLHVSYSHHFKRAHFHMLCLVWKPLPSNGGFGNLATSSADQEAATGKSEDTTKRCQVKHALSSAADTSVLRVM